MPGGRWADLSGRRRTIAARVYARDQADPHYLCPGRPDKPCGQPIDWTLRFPHPMSRSCDHTDELQDGGDLTDTTHMRTMHLSCNAAKGASRRHQRERAVRPAHAPIHIDPRSL